MAYRNKKRDFNNKRTLVPFILISLALHTLLFFLQIDITVKDYHEDLINIQYYDLDQAESGKIEKPEVLEPEKEKLPEGQVVDIAKPKVEKKPEKSKFLSKYDSSVDKETKSDFDKNIEKKGEKLQRKLSVEVTGIDTNVDDIIVSGDIDKPAADTLEKIKKGHLKGFDGEDGKHIKGEERAESGILTGKDEKHEEGARYLGGRTVPRRFLPYMHGRDFDLMSPSNDYLKDVEKSDKTALNTHKYLYSAYFNTIKQAVSRHWTPAQVLMINDPRGHIYGRKNRYTKIIAVIKSNGVLASIRVETSSGMDFLDREAVNAFKMASPFRNPPEPLLNDEGFIEIHFGFMVSME